MADKATYDKILKDMQALPLGKQQEFLLAQIALVQPQVMLQDMLDPTVRNAALFNAVTALLKHHKIEVDPVAGARPDHPIGALAHGMPPPDWEDDVDPMNVQ